MGLKTKYEIIPWFSSHEWRSVYENIFGNKAEDWKKAFIQISVWKSRVPALAAGIESTIPLLQAKMAFSDSSLEQMYQNSILNMAILRFVSIVAKGFEDRERFSRAEQEDLAFYRNLPQFLITQRNEIAHNHNELGTSWTLKSALEYSLDWIKINYWEKEEIQMSKIGKKWTVSKEDIDDDDDDDRSLIDEMLEGEGEAEGEVQGSSEKLKMAIESYLSVLVLDPSSLPVKSTKVKRKRIKLLIKEFECYMARDPRDAMKVIVAELFYCPQLRRACGRRKNLKSSCGQCDVRIPKALVDQLSFVMLTNMDLYSVNMFVNELLKIGGECPILCSQWIKVVITTAYFTPKNTGCSRHRFALGAKKFELGRMLKVEALLYQLFTFGKQWSSALALQICKHSIWKKKFISKSKIFQKLIDIHQSRTTQRASLEQHGTETEPNTGILNTAEEILTLKNVIRRAELISPNAYNYARTLSRKGKGKRKKIQRIQNEGSPLGVLPHQVGDPFFYLQLVLNPELDPPPSKRPKLMRNTSTA